MSLNKLLIGVIAAAFFTGSLYLVSTLGPARTSTTTKTSTSEVIHVGQIINPNGSSPTPTALSATTGDTVLTLLQKTQTITTKTYSFGTSVESINGLVNGTHNKYWLYYVNGQSASVGADRFALKSGDVVEWKFEISK